MTLNRYFMIKILFKYSVLLLLVFLLSQCTYKTFVFYSKIDDKKKRIHFKVPLGYSEKLTFWDANLRSIGIIYSDSSIVYIADGNSKFLPNYHSVEYQKLNMKRQVKDTSVVTYGGIFNNIVWKELVYKDQVWIGYSEVPYENRQLFDKALDKSLPKERN